MEHLGGYNIRLRSAICILGKPADNVGRRRLESLQNDEPSIVGIDMAEANRFNNACFALDAKVSESEFRRR
jgi:hypothetical protein